MPVFLATHRVASHAGDVFELAEHGLYGELGRREHRPLRRAARLRHDAQVALLLHVQLNLVHAATLAPRHKTVT